MDDIINEDIELCKIGKNDDEINEKKRKEKNIYFIPADDIRHST